MADGREAYDFDGHHVTFTRWESDVYGDSVAATVKCDGCEWRLHTGAYAGEVGRDGAEALVRVCCGLNSPGVIR